MDRSTQNAEIKAYILKSLSEVEFTHTYGFIIRDAKMVKLAIVENADEIMEFITVCEKNAKSHGAEYGVRMWNSNTAFKIIKSYAREIITLESVAKFESDYQTAKKNGYYGNRGNYGEDLAARVTGGIQNTSKNAKCTECGDMVLNGEHIQIKLWNATVTTESQVARFKAQALG